MTTASTTPRYTRLTRRVGYSFLARHSLWLGPDHLLSVRNYRFSEDYRRYQWGEIEAFIVQGTSRAWAERVGAGVMLLLFLAIGWAIGGELGVYFAVFLGGTCLGMLVISLVLGPTCTCHVRTAASVEELPALRRLRRARKVINRLRPLIEAVQGPLAPAAVQAFYERPPVLTASGPVPAPARVVASAYRGRWHVALFGLLLVDATISVVGLYAYHIGLQVIEWVIFLGLLAVLVGAITGQRHGGMPRAVQAVTWITLVYLVVMLGVGSMAAFVMLALEDPEALANQWDAMRYTFSEEAHGSFVMRSLRGFAAVLSSVLGLIGLAGLRRWRSRQTAAKVPPKMPEEIRNPKSEIRSKSE